MLHGHIYGRGNPDVTYIEDVKLDGPVAGLNFDMMGKTAGQPGNDAKVKWKQGEIEKVVSRLKQEIETIKEAYAGLGLNVITE